MLSELFHVSDQPNITRFEPRPPPSPRPGLEGAMVWAIDRAHLHNYLLPRDCPRVTFYATPTSDPADVDRLLAGVSARHVVAIEADWLPAVRAARLYQYALPPRRRTPAGRRLRMSRHGKCESQSQSRSPRERPPNPGRSSRPR